MELTRTAYGTWSGGRFMHFGEPLPDERFLGAIRLAYESGIRTFVTSDVYGNGAADEMLGRALEGVPRDSYCLVGILGHDFYTGTRDGSKGYPRFTDPRLRKPSEYGGYLKMATEKMLERTRTDHFDCLMLHNPDSTGFTSDAVWNGLEQLRSEKMTQLLGVAPGPANGFSLDMILNFERFGALIDWAMIILSPMEPWPGSLVLPAAQKHGVKILTRVVDHGGIFHDDVKPGHEFPKYDHRTFRPKGWVEAGNQKMEKMRAAVQGRALTPLQLACIWNLSHPNVLSVAPTMIQEACPGAKPIEDKIRALAQLPEIRFTEEELLQIEQIGNNKGCMELKGGNPGHAGEPMPDRWGLTPDLEGAAARWNIVPSRDLVCNHTA